MLRLYEKRSQTKGGLKTLRLITTERTERSTLCLSPSVTNNRKKCTAAIRGKTRSAMRTEVKTGVISIIQGVIIRTIGIVKQSEYDNVKYK